MARLCLPVLVRPLPTPGLFPPLSARLKTTSLVWKQQLNYPAHKGVSSCHHVTDTVLGPRGEHGTKTEPDSVSRRLAARTGRPAVTRYAGTSTVYLVVTQTKGRTIGLGQSLAAGERSWLGRSEKTRGQRAFGQRLGMPGEPACRATREPVEGPGPEVGSCLVHSSWRRDAHVAGVRGRLQGSGKGR